MSETETNSVEADSPSTSGSKQEEAKIDKNFIERLNPYITITAAIVAIIVAVVGLPTAIVQRNQLALQNDKSQEEIKGLHIDNSNKNALIDSQIKQSVTSLSQSAATIEELKEQVELLKVQRRKSELSMEAGAPLPEFAFTYITMDLSTYGAFREDLERRHASLFPKCITFRNDLDTMVSSGKYQAIVPNFRLGPNHDYNYDWQLDANKAAKANELTVTCLVVQQDEGRTARNAGIEFKYIPVAGPLNLLSELISPTVLITQKYHKAVSIRKYTFGDLRIGEGRIIPLFISLQNPRVHVAFGPCAIPLNVIYTDSNGGKQRQVKYKIPPMGERPYNVQEGIDYSN